jgi:hypothetical protein
VTWPHAARVYLSSTLLGGDLDGLLRPEADHSTRVVHPFGLPGQLDPARRRFRAWLAARGLALVDERRQAEAYFACLAMNDAIQHAGRHLVRDYLLDILDHAQGLAAYVAFRPNPGFGPGQRYLSRGGFVIPLTGGRPDNDGARFVVP